MKAAVCGVVATNSPVSQKRQSIQVAISREASLSADGRSCFEQSISDRGRRQGSSTTMFKAVMHGVALAGATALLSISALADGPSARSGQQLWTGFYVGGSAGWAWGDADLGSKFGCPTGDDCPYPTS